MKKLVVGFNDESEFTAIKRMQRSKSSMWKGYSILANGRSPMEGVRKGYLLFFLSKVVFKRVSGWTSRRRLPLIKLCWIPPGLNTLNAPKTLPLIRRKLKSGICQSLITSALDCQRFLWKNPPAQTDLSVIATMQPYTDLKKTLARSQL